MRQNASEESVVWPTDRGYLNIGSINRTAQESLMLRYRVETGAAIVGRPAYLPPDPKVPGDSGLIVAVSRDGDVHVIQEKNGEYLWRFSTGEPVVASPAVIGNHVYVCTQLGGMYCLETDEREGSVVCAATWSSSSPPARPGSMRRTSWAGWWC